MKRVTRASPTRVPCVSASAEEGCAQITQQQVVPALLSVCDATPALDCECIFEIRPRVGTLMQIL